MLLRKNLAPREDFNLGLAMIHFYCACNANHFSLKSDNPRVTCRFRPCWDVADESLIRVLCTEIKEDVSIFAGVDGYYQPTDLNVLADVLGCFGVFDDLEILSVETWSETDKK